MIWLIWTDIRQIPGGFETTITPLIGLCNGKSRPSPASSSGPGLPRRHPHRWSRRRSAHLSRHQERLKVVSKPLGSVSSTLNA
jgi:hypothetical protein